MTLDPWQANVLNSTSQRIAMLASRQVGKALHIETPILTPSGWTTMGALAPGDQVFDEAGRPRRVLSCSPVELRQTYRVRFSDGSEIIADGEHLWTTLDARTRSAISRGRAGIPERWWEWRARGRRPARRRKEGKAACAFSGCDGRAVGKGLCTGHYQQQKTGRVLAPLYHPRPGAETLTTEALAKTLTCSARGDANHSIPTARPLEFPEAELPVSPYLLGVWLGDGHSADGRLTFADEDSEIAARIRGLGYEVERQKSGTSAPNWCVRGLMPLLRGLGVLGDKHIPAAYLCASVAQRIELLRGLMDTDGHARSQTHTSRCEFDNTNKRLVDGVAELLAGLGVVFKIKEGRAKVNGRDVGPKWRAGFAPWFQAFGLGRKGRRVFFDKPRRTRRQMRYVTAVEPNGVGAVRCISIDSPSRLYLAGRSLIPTHNSTVAAALALATAVLEAPALVLVISPSERQSGELVQKVKNFYAALKRPRSLAGQFKRLVEADAEQRALEAAWAALPEQERESALQLHLDNGSRILGLPAKPSTVVGYSGATLLLIDEAARVGDELYRSVRPMLAASRGRLVALSTPFGKRGWFFEEWEGANAWMRVKVMATDCPRIPAAFLEEEERSLGERWYEQEYNCSFRDAIDSVFGASVIEAARSDDVQPW